MTSWPSVSLRHLARLTDSVGIVEHARFDRPRQDLGYCTDDAARLLAVASTVPSDPDAHQLATISVGFLARAHDGAAGFRLRLGPDGTWTDDPPSDDAVGRALYGLGTAAVRAPWPDVRDAAVDLFDAAAGFRSAHPRAVAYAALGAVTVLDAAPTHEVGRGLLTDAAARLPRAAGNAKWPWPEPRLTYANALLVEGRLAVAAATGNRAAEKEALALLDWLVRQETHLDWFSFTPVGGRDLDGPGQPAFDQQPIEAAAMTDACARAFALSGDRRWLHEARRAASWFLGNNDTGAVMFDPSTDGGFDGLTADGVNRNQGAESTLAFVATMHRARALGLAPPQAAGERTSVGTRASRR